MSRPTDLHAYIRAWEAAMAEAGFPRARWWTHDIYHDGVSTGCTFTWTHDINSIFLADVNDEAYRDEVSRGWEAAHRAMLLCEPLRPEFVQISNKLASMLGR